MPASSNDSSRRLFLLFPVAAGCLYLLARPGAPRVPEIPIKEVMLEEAKALIAAGALVVDVRNRAAYEARHIAGAISAPVESLERRIPADLEQARALPIVVYCGDGMALGPEGTRVLNKAGFAGAVNLKPGLQGWAAAGLPIEQAVKPS